MLAAIVNIADGAWIFLGFIGFMLFAIVYGYYTRTGSAINHHPYGRRYTDAPGARRRPEISGREGIARMSARGTR